MVVTEIWPHISPNILYTQHDKRITDSQSVVISNIGMIGSEHIHNRLLVLGQPNFSLVSYKSPGNRTPESEIEYPRYV